MAFLHFERKLAAQNGGGMSQDVRTLKDSCSGSHDGNSIRVLFLFEIEAWKLYQSSFWPL